MSLWGDWPRRHHDVPIPSTPAQWDPRTYHPPGRSHCTDQRCAERAQGKCHWGIEDGEMLCYWPLVDLVVNFKNMIFKLIIQTSNLDSHCEIADICSQMNTMEPHWWEVTIGSCNDLVLAATNHYLSQCWFRYIFVALCMSLGHNGLILLSQVKSTVSDLR